MAGLPERLKDAHGLGVLLATVEYGIFLTVWPDKLKGLAPDGSQGILNLCVFIASVFWFLDYMLRTRHETRILEEKGILKKVERVSGVDWDVNFVVIPLALGFGALLAEVTSPVVYCMIAAVIQVADCIGLSVIQRNFFKAREWERDAPEPVVRTRVNEQTEKIRRVSQSGGAQITKRMAYFDRAYYEFYLYRFQFLQRTVKLLGFMTALSLSVAAKFSGNAQFAIDSSIVVLVTITIGESVLALWRHQLDANGRKESRDAANASAGIERG